MSSDRKALMSIGRCPDCASKKGEPHSADCAHRDDRVFKSTEEAMATLQAERVAVETTTQQTETIRTYKPRAIHARPVGGKAAQSWEVVRWPEFLAFAKRLGINLELPFRGLVIDLVWDDLVLITQTYIADDIDQEDAVTSFDDQVKK